MEASLPVSLHDGSALEIYGTCLAERAAIRAAFERRDWRQLIMLPGNHCLASRTGSSVTLVGCAIGAPNLFYMEAGGRLVYASGVVDVVRLAGVPWRWNWRALADVTMLEHCIDGDTLHADVRRLRAGEVVQFDGSKLDSWQIPWEERIACAKPSPEDALSALVRACQRYADRDVIVSMSAGFDSRVLLACLLACGKRPRLLTMGSRDSTDVRISEAIAIRFGLPLSVVKLDSQDYLRFGATITRITGGSKTFQNWHTYLYARSAQLSPASRLFIGSNGEVARSYYLDKGIAATSADRFASTLARRAFWSAKSRAIFTPDEIALLHPRFARELSAEGAAERVQRLLALSDGALLRGLDRFYVEQRVTNFIANGLSLVTSQALPGVPMLDAEWTAQVSNLPRQWKLDSRWHRFAIASACPELLQFEEEKTGAPMRARPTPLYWLPHRGRAPRPYMDYSRLLRGGMVERWVNTRRGQIEPLARRALVSLVLDRHASGGNRLRPASFLLTMLSFLECLREEGLAVSHD